MKKHLKRSLSLLLALFLLLCVFGCADSANDTQSSSELTSADAQTVTVPADSETEPADTTPQRPAREPDVPELRVLITSDTHFTHLQTWYGVSHTDRMQRWVDAIKEEHAKDPYDLIIVAGDTSLDHWGSGGSWLNEGVSTAKLFVEQYVSQLPKDVPVFVMPGNHEAFTEEQWFSLTGYHRQDAVAMNGNLFILVDSFNKNLDPQQHYGGSHHLTPIKTDYIEEQMALYPDHNVYLVAHYFDYQNATKEFKDLIKNNDRIIMLFEAHKHVTDIIFMGAEYGNKVLAHTGNFSYTGDDASTETIKRSFWGFRELEIYDDHCETRYIVVKSQAKINGQLTNVPRQIVDSIPVYYKK